MSGHSHFSSIKYKKAITDAKRGQIFSKLARQISITAKEKGGGIENNPALRIVVEKAKEFNMPKQNIERAIKRGTGELEGVKLEQVLLEAYGPGGIAIIVEGITDNKNRTLGEIKQILNQYNGKLASEGSVKWLFNRNGCIIINVPNSQSKEDLYLTVIDAGAEDVYWHDDILDVYTKPEELEKVKKNLREKAIKIESASLDWIAKEAISLSENNKATCQKLFEVLDENDSVQEIYSNLKV